MLIAFDIKLMKPACILVAAAMDADTQFIHQFDTKHWLLAPTPDMKVYPITDTQLAVLIERVNNT